jgi:restriction system protein
MAIPNYEKIMLPLFKITADEKEHTLEEVSDTLAEQFSLTEADRKELLASGRQGRFDNRVGWAKTALKKAGLIDNPRRGIFLITEQGLQLLKSNPAKIDVQLLMQYPGFKEYQTPSREVDKTIEETGEKDRQTPEEVLEANYQELRRTLAKELIDRIMICSPKFFERLVVDLLVKMGYGGSRKDAGEAIGQSGDGGIDGIIKEDKLGLDALYIQAKRWNGTVGRPIVQAFAGSLEGQKAKKGILISTSQFSQDAKDYVTRIEKRIILIDGEQLAQYMIDNNVGVAEMVTYPIKRVDLDYFDEEQ